MLTPDNYDAYKGRQRRDDDKRKQFQAVTRLEDDGSTLTDAQLSDRVASLTGNTPAPEEVVRDNRALFREADDKTWAEKLRDSAPITLAMAGDPKNAPLPREHYDLLASVEQAAGKLVTASQQTDPQPPAPVPVAATSADATSTPPENPGVNVESVPDGDSSQTAVAAVPAGAQAGPATAAPVTQGNQGVDVASARGGIPPQMAPAAAPTGTEAEQAAAASATKENSAANTVGMPGGGFSQATSSTGPSAAGQGGIQPSRERIASVDVDGVLPVFGSDPRILDATTFKMPQIKLPDAPSAGASLALGIAGLGKNPGYSVVRAFQDLIDKQPYIPKDLALGVLDGVVTGSLTQEQALEKLTAASSAVGQGGDSAIAGADSSGLGDGIPPDSYVPFWSSVQPMPLGPTFEMPEIKLRKDAPSTRAALAEGIAGLGKNPGYAVMAAYRDLIAKQPDIPQDLALDVLNGVADGSLTQEQALEKLNYTPSPEREKLADEVANSLSLTEDEAKALEERLKHQPYIPVEQALDAFRSVRGMKYGPKEAKDLLMATTDEELSDITDDIIHAKEKNPEEIETLRKRIYGMNAIDPLLADKVLADILGDKVDEKTARRILARIGTVDHIVESVKGLIGSAWDSIGNYGELTGRVVKNAESDLHKSLVKDIMNTRGKGPEEFGVVQARINKLTADDYYMQTNLLEGLEMVRDGRDPDEVLDHISPERAGSNMIELGQQRRKDAKDKFGALEGRKQIFGRRAGEMLGPVGVGLALNVGIPGMAVIYPAANEGAKTYNDATDAKASEENALKAAGGTTLLNLLGGLPWGAAAMRLPGLNKLAGSFVDRNLLQPAVDSLAQVGVQAGTNVVAKLTYDKNRDYLEDTGVAAATSVLLSGLKIGGGAVVGRGRAAVNSYYARNAITEAQEAIRRNGVLKDMEGLLEQKIPYARDRKAIYDMVQQKVKGTSEETLYFQADTFIDSLVKADIDPKAFVESLGGVTLGDFQKAFQTGGYVRIPLASYAAHVMGTKASNVLREHATFKPGGSSAAKAEEVLKGRPINLPKGTATAPPEDKPAPTSSSSMTKAIPAANAPVQLPSAGSNGTAVPSAAP